MTATMTRDSTYRFPDVWTVEDLALLPDDGHRYEIIEGALHMSPPPANRHQKAAGRLHVLLDRMAPADLEPAEGVGIMLSETSMLIPDLVVAIPEALDRVEGLLEPHEVRLAVEVTSPSSTRMDRLLKPAIYAEAGVPWYWRIDLANQDAPTLVVHRLVAGCYVVETTVHPGEEANLNQPFPVTVQPGELIGARHPKGDEQR